MSKQEKIKTIINFLKELDIDDLDFLLSLIIEMILPNKD